MEPENTPLNVSPAPRKLNAGLRILIFTALLFVTFNVIGLFALVLRQALGYKAGQVTPGSQLLLDGPIFLAALVSTWVMSKIERRKLGDFGLPLKRSAGRSFLRGYLLWGFVPISLQLLTMRALHLFYFGSLSLHDLHIFYWAAVWGVVFLFVALAEEYVYRGYALCTVAEVLGFWPATIIMAVLFAYAHTGNAGETRIGIISVALFGIFVSATLRRTGNLWLAVGAHAGWDWAQSFFYGVNDSGLQLQGHLFNPHISGPSWLTGGCTGPEGSVLSLGLLAVMTVIFLVMYRTRNSEPAADSAD